MKNEYIKKSNGLTENYDEAIKNNNLLIEDLKEGISQDLLIGILWNKDEQSYSKMDNSMIIDRLEEVIEEQEEEDEEEIY